MTRPGYDPRIPCLPRRPIPTPFGCSMFPYVMTRSIEAAVIPTWGVVMEIAPRDEVDLTSQSDEIVSQGVAEVGDFMLRPVVTLDDLIKFSIQLQSVVRIVLNRLVKRIRCGFQGVDPFDAPVHLFAPVMAALAIQAGPLQDLVGKVFDIPGARAQVTRWIGIVVTRSIIVVKKSVESSNRFIDAMKNLEEIIPGAERMDDTFDATEIPFDIVESIFKL